MHTSVLRCGALLASKSTLGGHFYFVRHLGLIGSHDRNLFISASGVFDILALYKLDYYYYYYPQ